MACVLHVPLVLHVALCCPWFMCCPWLLCCTWFCVARGSVLHVGLCCMWLSLRRILKREAGWAISAVFWLQGPVPLDFL